MAGNGIHWNLSFVFQCLKEYDGRNLSKDKLFINNLFNRKLNKFHLQGVPDEISNRCKTHMLTKPPFHHCCKADEAQALHGRPEVARAARFTAHDVGNLTHYVLKFNCNENRSDCDILILPTALWHAYTEVSQLSINDFSWKTKVSLQSALIGAELSKIPFSVE